MYAIRPTWLGSTAAALTVWMLSTAALAADTKSAEDWFREGVEAMGAGKLPEATQAFQYCVQYKPDLKECWFNLGIAYGRQREYAKEATSYQEAVKLDPNYARAHFNLAVAYEELGRGTDALKHYDLAIAAEPAAVDAHTNRAMLLLQLERWDEALTAFEKLVTLQPDSAEALFDLAQAEEVRAGKSQEPQRTGFYKKAIAHYAQATSRDPQHFRAWYNLGVVYHKLRDLPSEIDAYKKALAIKPGHVSSLYNLAFALRDSGDKAAAKQAFAQYIAAAEGQKAEARFVELAKKELAKL
jgi:tetratricopeptide (TPR) repeat protein